MQFKNVFPIAFIHISLSILLTGCATPLPKPPVVELKDAVPYARSSRYTDALERLGDVVKLYKDTPKVYYVLDASDKSASGGKLPGDIKMMVESALQRIGPSVKVKSDPSKGQKPDYYIQGAITEFDHGILTTGSRRSIGLFGKVKGKEIDIGNDADTGTEQTRIAIEFTVIDDEGNRLPGMLTDNRIIIESINKNDGYSFSILGNGLSVNGNTSAQTGFHEALRRLVDLSIVQLISRLRNYPYWITMEGSDPDYKVLNHIKQSIASNEKSETLRIAMAKLMLKELDSRAALYDDETPNDYAAKLIKDIKQSTALFPVDSSITTDFVVKLLEEFPRRKFSRQLSTRSSQMLDSVLK